MIVVFFASVVESKNIKLNFLISALGGANYFRWLNGTPYTGWGKSYGLEGELQIVFKKENIGFGLSYGNIYETAIAKNPYTSWVWTRGVVRTPILIKLLLNPLGKINSWVGGGKDDFRITYVRRKIAVEIRDSQLEGTETFQIIVAGIDIKPWRNFMLSGEFRFGANETHNTVKTTDFESWQFLIGGKYGFSK